MSKKKTQAQNAMKPDPSAQKAAEGGDKANQESADAATKEAAKTGDQTGQDQTGGAGQDQTGDNASGAIQGTEAENHPSPDERQKDSGTSAGVDKSKDGIIEDEEETMTDEERALKEKNEAAAEEELDLNNPQHIAKLVDELIDGAVSLGHPLLAALANKPKVAESWNKVVDSAKKLQRVRNAHREQNGA